MLSSDPTSCSQNALQALFAGKPIQPCRAAPAPVLERPTPLPPARLGDVPAAKGNFGRPGRTLSAVLLTLSDFGYQVAVQALAQVEEQAGGLSLSTFTPPLRVGGLRSGWGELAAGRFTLHGYSYVPGVTVSGEITAERTALTVGGPAAAPGSLSAASGSSGSQATLAGLLEGREVHLRSPAAGVSGPLTAASDLLRVGATRELSPRARSRLLAVAARLRPLIGLSR